MVNYGDEGRVAKPSPLERVTILGTGISIFDYMVDRSNFPEAKKEGCETWAINGGGLILACDKLFSMHDFEKWEKDNENIMLLAAFKKTNIPIITTRALPDYPTALEFPLAECVSRFNDWYFRNTLAYMIAYAMMCEVKELHFYGCDFTYGTEHREAAQANVEYWVGRAKQQGITIGVCEDSQFLETSKRDKGELGFYGYSKRPKLMAQGTKIEVVGFNDEFESML